MLKLPRLTNLYQHVERAALKRPQSSAHLCSQGHPSRAVTPQLILCLDFSPTHFFSCVRVKAKAQRPGFTFCFLHLLPHFLVTETNSFTYRIRTQPLTHIPGQLRASMKLLLQKCPELLSTDSGKHVQILSTWIPPLPHQSQRTPRFLVISRHNNQRNQKQQPG